MGGMSNNFNGQRLVPKDTRVCSGYDESSPEKSGRDWGFCHRLLYGGDTEQCKSDLKVKILECKCEDPEALKNCKDAGGKNEVHTAFSHVA